MKLNELKCFDENINLDEYITFREMVKQHMEYPEWLGDFTKEDLADMVNNQNAKIWIYYLNDEPICSMMLIKSSLESLKKFGLDLTLEEVIDYGPMFVNPNYWGNGLQYQMLLYLDDYCKNLGYNYVVGTIHPDNSYSIHNLVKDDFHLIGTKNFKRGIRNIYLKQFSK